MIGRRSALAQAATYRVLVIAADFLLLWALFGSPGEAGAITAVRHAVQTALFALHETAWGRVPWGRSFGHALRRRTLAKAVTFRTLALLNDFVILFLFTSEPAESAGIAVMVAALNTTLYYAHERVWDRRP